MVVIPGGTKEAIRESEDGQMLWHQDGHKEWHNEKKGCVVDEEKKTDCYDESEEESRDLYTEIEETEVLGVPPPPPPPPLPPRQVTLRRCFLISLPSADCLPQLKLRMSRSKQCNANWKSCGLQCRVSMLLCLCIF